MKMNKLCYNEEFNQNGVTFQFSCVIWFFIVNISKLVVSSCYWSSIFQVHWYFLLHNIHPYDDFFLNIDSMLFFLCSIYDLNKKNITADYASFVILNRDFSIMPMFPLNLVTKWIIIRSNSIFKTKWFIKVGRNKSSSRPVVILNNDI